MGSPLFLHSRSSVVCFQCSASAGSVGSRYYYNAAAVQWADDAGAFLGEFTASADADFSPAYSVAESTSARGPSVPRSKLSLAGTAPGALGVCRICSVVLRACLTVLRAVLVAR